MEIKALLCLCVESKWTDLNMAYFIIRGFDKQVAFQSKCEIRWGGKLKWLLWVSRKEEFLI